MIFLKKKNQITCPYSSGGSKVILINTWGSPKDLSGGGHLQAGKRQVSGEWH